MVEVVGVRSSTYDELEVVPDRPEVGQVVDVHEFVRGSRWGVIMH